MCNHILPPLLALAIALAQVLPLPTPDQPAGLLKHPCAMNNSHAFTHVGLVGTKTCKNRYLTDQMTSAMASKRISHSNRTKWHAKKEKVQFHGNCAEAKIPPCPLPASMVLCMQASHIWDFAMGARLRCPGLGF